MNYENTNCQPALPPKDGSAIPRALFSCSNEYCRVEVSYHADQLYWHAAERRWVCEACWDDLPSPTDEEGRPTRGVTLAEHIIGGRFPAVALLQHCGCAWSLHQTNAAVCQVIANGWHCSKIEGHRGEHVACTPENHGLHRWPNDQAQR